MLWQDTATLTANLRHRGGTMKPQIKAILDLLGANDFPYTGRDLPRPRLRSWADPVRLAFDVPESVYLDVSEHIVELLWPVETQPMWLGGAIHDFESAEQRARLPEDTVWYEPRRTHAQTN
jgi:hypothetical protein